MKKLHGILKLSAFLLFVAIMASCKKDEDPYAGYTAERESALIKEWKSAMKLEEFVIDSTLIDIYFIRDTAKIGAGPTVVTGDQLTVKYTGMFLNGQVFDSSTSYKYTHKDTDPYKRMIPGWEEGIEVLKKGESAAFLIPSAKAYGTDGSTPIIPPNEPLIFIIEVVDIQ